MQTISRRWWMLVVRGVASFALAMLLAVGPAWGSSRVVAVAFGIYALLDGAGSLALVWGARDLETTAYAGRGILGMTIGTLVLAHPAASTTGLCLGISVWGIGTGLLELTFGSRTWFTLPKAVGFMLVGALSLGLGASLVWFPLEGAPFLRGFLVAYAVFNGIGAIALGETMHRLPAGRPA